MADRIGAVILAAGASRRLGQPKQLVELGGEPLIRRAARLALSAGCSPVIVVLGACDAPCRAALADLTDLLAVHHPGWAEGMGSTLRCGMETLLAPAAAAMSPESVLIMVVDQVRLSADSLARLLQAHASHHSPATAAAYSGRLGVPAVFRSELFPTLLALQGDQGARAILAQLHDRAASVNLPEAAADLDTPDDLAQMQ